MTARRPARVSVAAVGNEWRRDDGVGPAVLRSLRPRDGVTQDAVSHPLDLLEVWPGVDTAVVVDALPEGVPGTVRVLELASARERPSRGPGVNRSRGLSSHGLGVVDAVATARLLGSAPRRVVLVGVVGEDFGHGPGFSAPVSAAVPEAVLEVERITAHGFASEGDADADFAQASFRLTVARTRPELSHRRRPRVPNGEQLP